MEGTISSWFGGTAYRVPMTEYNVWPASEERADQAILLGTIALTEADFLIATNIGITVPNPYGSKGNPSHQAAVKALEKTADAEFPGDIIHKGTSIKTQTGVNRRPDVWVEDANNPNNVKMVYEAARTNTSGSFVSREVVKRMDYSQAGIPSTFKSVE
jgi:hypothetical protein